MAVPCSFVSVEVDVDTTVLAHFEMPMLLILACQVRQPGPSQGEMNCIQQPHLTAHGEPGCVYLPNLTSVLCRPDSGKVGALEVITQRHAD